MKKKITSVLIGIMVRGTSEINLWGGGTGEMDMEETFIPADKVSKDNIMRCVNDGQFGCESIESAYVSIYAVYKSESGAKTRVRDRTIYIDSELAKLHQDKFCRGIQVGEDA